MPLYTRRLHIVVTAAERAAANQAAQGLSGNPADGGTFNLPLSPTGQAPATHYRCCVALTEAAYQQVLTQLLPAFPGARVDEMDVALATGRDVPGRALAALGVKPIEPAGPPA
jgi:hypothetical protein